ncbi:conserved hypothetical protein [Candidatus Sulfopaludibacter sp. SbA4]|nr:conserved hypothetical protein [Candidatus Sulfopaludibacter sp. SbA4]
MEIAASGRMKFLIDMNLSPLSVPPVSDHRTNSADRVATRGADFIGGNRRENFWQPRWLRYILERERLISSDGLPAMVKTINLNAEIPANRELHLTLPDDVPVGPAEIVLVVSSRTTTGTPTLGELADSEFCGMWANRSDIRDSAEFARQLRTEGWKRSA